MLSNTSTPQREESLRAGQGHIERSCPRPTTRKPSTSEYELDMKIQNLEGTARCWYGS